MRLGTMSSAEVARRGYDGMMSGQRLVIPGLLNKVGVQAVRISPRRLVTVVTRALHGTH